MVGIILFGMLFLLALLGLPIAFAIVLGSLTSMLYIGHLPVSLIAQRMVVMVDSFALLAVPLFMLAGEIMTVGASSRRLVEFSMAMFGHIRGSLAHVSVITSMIFSGISGSASADTAAVGSIMIPAMIKKGYDPDFATAIQASAGTIGPIIPPSIPMIILAYLSGISVAELFLGGMIPGILIGVSLMVAAHLYVRKRGETYLGEKASSARSVLSTGLRALPALGLPIIILGGIFAGVFTATEAAAVAVFYGLFVELFVYRELRLKDLPGVLSRAAIVSSMVMFICAASGAFAWILSFAEIPQVVASLMLSISSNKVVALVLIAFLILIAGTSLDTTATLIIFTPILMPVVHTLGIDSIHFGLVVVVGLAIGMITPPVGLGLFVACGLSGRSVSTAIRPLLPILIGMLIVFMLITFVPSFVTLLPSLLRGP